MSRSRSLAAGGATAKEGEAAPPRFGDRFAGLKHFSVLIPVVMLPLGIWLGSRIVRGRTMADLMDAVLSIPHANLLFALVCAAGSYLCLTGFDALAVRYLGRDLSYRRIALTSFVSLGIGHTVGVAVLSSGALRYRFYSGFGFSAADVGKIILFCGFTVGLGLTGIAGIVLAVRPELGLGAIGVAPALGRAVGLLCLALVLFYMFLAWRRRTPFSIRGLAFRLPSVGIAAAQVIIGILDFAFVAGSLYFLLAGAATYAEATGAYVLGNVSTLVSHVPGGVGVLEYVIAAVVNGGDVLGALIAFRIAYFLIPLVLATALLIGAEIVRWRGK